MKNKIKERRTELGMTQAELAGKCDMGQSTVSEIEDGKHTPTVDVALRLAAALEKQVEELFIVD